MENNYKICSKTIMDTTDPDIEFDSNGISNHWRNYFSRLKDFHVDNNLRDARLNELVSSIKKRSNKKNYDCIIGVSGGVDSTYACYLAKKNNLNPLAIHFDNGWNSEIAVSNIENTLKELNIELYTYVVDWNEFKDLQLSFLMASTPDGEVPTDHGMIALLYKMAYKLKVKHILTGVNFKTESVLPLKWGYGYFDLKYIKGIQKKFGTYKLKSYPKLSLLKLLFYSKICGIRFIPFLDYFEYDKAEAMNIIINKLGWKDYGGKHYESVYTRFYQSYILPVKFNIDKRRAHLSNLICSGQLSREDALQQIKKEPYPKEKLKNDKKFVLNKFEINETELNKIMRLELKTFMDYKTNYKFFEFLKFIKKIFFDRLNIRIFEIE